MLISPDDFLLSSTSPAMTSPIKIENHFKRNQSHRGSMSKNLHLSEVITTAAATNNQHYHGLVGQQRHGVLVDPIEMTKLLSNITTNNNPVTHSPVTKPVSTSSNMDYSSRLNHFSWEEIEGRYLPVIFRNENGCLQRYTSKLFVENTLFQSESWQRHAILARSLPPLISFPYTENEFKLFRSIVEWHLAGFHFKTIPPSDCLIRFEDLLDFYGALRKLRDKASSTSFNRPLPPPPPALIPPPMPVAPPVPPKQRISSNGLAQSFELPTMGDNPPLKPHLPQHRHPTPTTKTYPVPPSLHPSANYLLPQSVDLRSPSFNVPQATQSFNFTTTPSTKVLPPTATQWNDGLVRTHDKHRATLTRPMIPMNPVPLHRPLPSAPSVPSDSSMIREKSSSQPPAKFYSSSSVDSVPQQARDTKESGWVQINNVFVPYIVKLKLRENDLEKCSTRQPAPQLQRELYVPYEILIKCHIFSDHEFAFKKFLIKATQQDFDIFNSLISNINIFDEKVPEKTLLVNLYHVMIGLQRVLYVKLLTTKQPRTQVNKYHADVLTHKGGTLRMPDNIIVPYIIQNNRFYVPLLYAYQSMPNIVSQAKRGARAPRQYEIDYLNLLFLYFSIDAPPLTSDTLLVDPFTIKISKNLQPVHVRTLNEHQQHERNRLLNILARLTQNNNKVSTNKTQTNNNKVPAGLSSLSSSQKSNKSLPTNVVVNPLIHHPSFYGLTPSSSKSTPPPPPPPTTTISSSVPSKTIGTSIQSSIKHNSIKTIVYDHQTLNAIVKLADLPMKDWKISIREIFEKFHFDIDYEKFVQWCLNNSLLPLITLDEDEKRIVSHQDKNEDFYVYQRHLERCVSLLNDLKRGTISMTLLPQSNSDVSSDASNNFVKSPLAGISISGECQGIDFDRLSGAKKRKPTGPTVRHISPVSEALAIVPIRSPELQIQKETSTIRNDEMAKITDEQINNDVQNEIDDDAMPVVATVEESRPFIERETSLIIVETNEGDETKIQLDDTLPSCSSGYESAAPLTNVDPHIRIHPSSDDDDDETNSTTRSRIASSSCQSEHSLALIPSNSHDNDHEDENEQKRKTNSSSPVMMSICDRQQQMKIGKFRRRSVSPPFSSAKKTRRAENLPLSDNLITSEQIEQHLRTLLMPTNEQRRIRTRPIKTPTRLVEEISSQYALKVSAVAAATEFEQNNNNVFEMFSSSPNSSTNESPTFNRSQSEDPNANPSCTYNVTMSNKPNKLGFTIKKVVQR